MNKVSITHVSPLSVEYPTGKALVVLEYPKFLITAITGSGATCPHPPFGASIAVTPISLLMKYPVIAKLSIFQPEYE